MTISRAHGILAGLALATWTGAPAAHGADTPSLSLGLRLQGWYVAEQDGAPDGGTAQDFLLRRGYLSLTGKLSSTVSTLVHLSSDRIGVDLLGWTPAWAAPVPAGRHGRGRGPGQPSRLAPAVRTAVGPRVLVTDGDDASLPSAGLNYLIRGHDLKLGADWSRAPRSARPASDALTVQAHAGF